MEEVIFLTRNNVDIDCKLFWNTFLEAEDKISFLILPL